MLVNASVPGLAMRNAINSSIIFYIDTLLTRIINALGGLQKQTYTNHNPMDQ